MNILKNKILLTGGTGFLGRYFVRLLLRNGYTPILLVRPTKQLTAWQRIFQLFTPEEASRIQIVEGDLTDIESREVFQKLNEDGEIQAMFHIAGLVKFDTDLKDQLYKVNVVGTKAALAVAKQLHIPKFYYVSTAYTAGIQDEAFEELHPLMGEDKFQNPYEESKCLAEHHVVNHHSPSCKTTILRPSIIIGDSNTGEADTQFSIYGFLRGLTIFKKKLLKHVQQDKGQAYFPLNIVGDPRGLSNLVPVNYVAELMLAALQNECEHSIYHLTNPFPPTKQLLLEVFSELLQVKGMRLVKKKDEWTEWDEKFEQFIHVYQPYMQDDPIFHTKNTNQLLARSGLDGLRLLREDYLRIFRPVLRPEEVEVAEVKV